MSKLAKARVTIVRTVQDHQGLSFSAYLATFVQYIKKPRENRTVERDRDLPADANKVDI